MTRVATPLVIADLSSFARNLSQALSAHHAETLDPPSHLRLQNLVARSAGYRNLQALKAAPPPPSVDIAPPLSANARRTLMQFDTEGRLVRWPNKFTVQRLAMWVLWTGFEGKRVYSEREVNAILRASNAFGDHATLRRELVDHRLLARKSDCSEYRKLPARADDEVRAMLTAFRAGIGARARPTPLRAVQPGPETSGPGRNAQPETGAEAGARRPGNRAGGR